MAKPENTIEIVRATAADLPLLVPLFDAYRQFYKQSEDLEGAEQFLGSQLADSTSAIFLAFCSDAQGSRQPCGFAQLYPSFSSVSMKRLWILNDLFVASNACKKGVGAALLARARTFAAETGSKGLTLTTGRKNKTAQKVYEVAGWKRDDEFYTYTMYS